MYIHNFVIISPWKGKKEITLLEQSWILFIQGCFVSSLVDISVVVLVKKTRMWNIYDNNNDDNGTEQFQSGKFIWAFCSCKLENKANGLKQTLQLLLHKSVWQQWEQCSDSRLLYMWRLDVHTWKDIYYIPINVISIDTVDFT